MLDKGVIRPSNSLWSAPAILVPKKSADGTPKYFRALNSVTKSIPTRSLCSRKQRPPYTDPGTSRPSTVKVDFGRYPLERNTGNEQGSLSILDTTSLRDFRSDYLILPQISSLMDIVLRNLIGTHCWIFIDDLIVFSNTAEEHAQ